MRTAEEQAEVNNQNRIVCEELLKVGVKIDSISYLVNTSESYPEAIETLVKLLNDKRITHEAIVESIVRSLTVKEAKGKAVPALLKLYFESEKSLNSLRWTIGSAVETIIAKDHVSEILKIIQDKSNGTSRQMFVMALGKMITVKGKIEPIIIDLLDDDDVRGHAIFALGKLKSTKAKEKISKFLNDPNAWIRREAKSALKKFEKFETSN